MTLSVLIVDDEQPARDRLAQLLGDLEGFRVAGFAANGLEAVEQAADADILLLDIRMPGMDGLEVAAAVNRLEQAPAIVFTTAYDEYAIAAFEAKAIGYVLKPVRRQRLKAALEQAQRLSRANLKALRSEEPRRHLCSQRAGELKLIPIDSVYYLEADQKYVNVRHSGGEDLIDESLKSLEDEFTEHFVRIHRSRLVAIKHIDGTAKDDKGRPVVVLRGASDDNALLISRRHVAEVRRRLAGDKS